MKVINMSNIEKYELVGSGSLVPTDRLPYPVEQQHSATYRGLRRKWIFPRDFPKGLPLKILQITKKLALKKLYFGQGEIAYSDQGGVNFRF